MGGDAVTLTESRNQLNLSEREWQRKLLSGSEWRFIITIWSCRVPLTSTSTTVIIHPCFSCLEKRRGRADKSPQLTHSQLQEPHKPNLCSFKTPTISEKCRNDRVEICDVCSSSLQQNVSCRRKLSQLHCLCFPLYSICTSLHYLLNVSQWLYIKWFVLSISARIQKFAHFSCSLTQILGRSYLICSLIICFCSSSSYFHALRAEETLH